MNEAGKVLFQQGVVTLALRLLAQSALTELAKVKGSRADAWLDESEAQVIHGVKGFVPTPNVPDEVFQRLEEACATSGPREWAAMQPRIAALRTRVRGRRR